MAYAEHIYRAEGDLKSFRIRQASKIALFQLQRIFTMASFVIVFLEWIWPKWAKVEERLLLELAAILRSQVE